MAGMMPRGLRATGSKAETSRVGEAAVETTVETASKNGNIGEQLNFNKKVKQLKYFNIIYTGVQKYGY
jgi:hypothetical protein